MASLLECNSGKARFAGRAPREGASALCGRKNKDKADIWAKLVNHTHSEEEMRHEADPSRDRRREREMCGSDLVTVCSKRM